MNSNNYSDEVKKIFNSYIAGKPQDIVTIYNKDILTIYDDLLNNIDNENLTNDERVGLVLLLADLYNKENDLLGLFVRDKWGNRYMNYLCSWPELTDRNGGEDHLNQIAEFFIIHLMDFFFHEREDDTIYNVDKGYAIKGGVMMKIAGANPNPLKNLPAREAAILELIFTSKKSLEILQRNYLGYDKYVNYRYKSIDDEKYCKAVLYLVKEIAIRTLNYEKYIAGFDYPDSTTDDVIDLYKRLARNAIKDKEYIDKSIFGKTLHKINQEIDYYIDEIKRR